MNKVAVFCGENQTDLMDQVNDFLASLDRAQIQLMTQSEGTHKVVEGGQAVDAPHITLTLLYR